MCCWFAVCPVPMTKEEEEFIKERERNRELMEEIAREIEMTTGSPSALFVDSGFRGHLVGIY